MSRRSRRERAAEELPPPAPRPQELAAHRTMLRACEADVLVAIDAATTAGHPLASLVVVMTPREDAFLREVVGDRLPKTTRPVYALAFTRPEIVQVFLRWSPRLPNGGYADVRPYAELGQRLSKPQPNGQLPVVVSDGKTAMVQYVDVATVAA